METIGLIINTRDYETALRSNDQKEIEAFWKGDC